MKTFIQIIAQEPVILNDWEGEGVEVIFKDFDVEPQGKIKILFASYTYEDYSGDAFILYTDYKNLYEVNGSHCSCYGLEGQWEPEEVELTSLVHRLTVGNLGVNRWYMEQSFNQKLREFIGIQNEEEPT